MSADFASLSYSLHRGSKKRGIPLKLGQAQQLLACAFGYRTLGGYQRLAEEPPEIDDGDHLIVDMPALEQRARDMGISVTATQLLTLVEEAFSTGVRDGGVHASEDAFYKELQLRLGWAVTENRRVATQLDFMATDGFDEIRLPFSFSLLDLPPIGGKLTIPVVGYVLMVQDEERFSTDLRVDVEASISMERWGRRLVGALRFDVQRAYTNTKYPREQFDTLGQAYARLLGLPVELTEQLDNVQMDENTGSSGEGFYGYIVDFSDADPQYVVQAILRKHGTLSFRVAPSFFDYVHPEE